VVQSSTPVQTSSTTLVDDTEAEKTFNLSSSKVVLVIYKAHMNHGSTGTNLGMQNAINVDGTDYANSWDAPYTSNYAVRNCVFWIGTLSSGSHTIKGRFASNSDGATVTIDRRVLIIMIFDGDEYQYVDNTTTATTSSGSLVDDPNASVTFTPSGNCKALILYNCSKSHGSTEYAGGKKAAINVNGTDYAQAEKSQYSSNYANSVFTCYALSLSATSTTVKGRYASNSDGSTVTIERRQLGVLLFADSTLLDVVTSETQVSTTSNTLVDDSEATITRTTNDTREVLIIAVGTKRHNTESSATGECYGINVDGTDKTWSRGSPYYAAYADSAATAYAIKLTSGSHTIKGRFSNNSGSDTAKIDARCLIAIWLQSTYWLTGWSYRRKITIDHTKIDNDLTDFPVLVKLTSSNFNFNHARNDGYDIRFTKDDGETLLKYERERHDAANEKAEYWVKIPSISSTTDTIFYIYYGKSDASDGEDAENVWDSNFMMVHHMNGSSYSDLKDSTSNNNDVTTERGNPTYNVEGKVDGAVDFERGNGDSLGIPDSPTLDGFDAYTIEMWFKAESFVTTDNEFNWLLCKYNTSGDQRSWSITIKRYAGELGFYHFYSDDGINYNQAEKRPVTLNTGTWYYIAWHRSGANQDPKLYLNAVEQNPTNNGTVGTLFNSSSGLDIGDCTYHLGEREFDGILDEIRISNIERSEAWIKATYHTIINDLLSYATEEVIEIEKMITDSLSFSDAILSRTILTVTDLFSLSDFYSRILETYRSYTEDLVLSEILARLSSIFRIETIGSSDSVSKEFLTKREEITELEDLKSLTSKSKILAALSLFSELVTSSYLTNLLQEWLSTAFFEADDFDENSFLAGPERENIIKPQKLETLILTKVLSKFLEISREETMVLLRSLSKEGLHFSTEILILTSICLYQVVFSRLYFETLSLIDSLILEISYVKKILEDFLLISKVIPKSTLSKIYSEILSLSEALKKNVRSIRSSVISLQEKVLIGILLVAKEGLQILSRLSNEITLEASQVLSLSDSFILNFYLQVKESFLLLSSLTYLFKFYRSEAFNLVSSTFKILSLFRSSALSFFEELSTSLKQLSQIFSESLQFLDHYSLKIRTSFLTSFNLLDKEFNLLKEKFIEQFQLSSTSKIFLKTIYLESLNLTVSLLKTLKETFLSTIELVSRLSFSLKVLKEENLYFGFFEAESFSASSFIVGDLLLKTIFKQREDLLTILDKLSIVFSTLRSFAEALTLQDVVSGISSLRAFLTASLKFQDLFSSKVTFEKVFKEFIKFGTLLSKTVKRVFQEIFLLLPVLHLQVVKALKEISHFLSLITHKIGSYLIEGLGATPLLAIQLRRVFSEELMLVKLIQKRAFKTFLEVLIVITIVRKSLLKVLSQLLTFYLLKIMKVTLKREELIILSGSFSGLLAYTLFETLNFLETIFSSIKKVALELAARILLRTYTAKTLLKIFAARVLLKTYTTRVSVEKGNVRVLLKKLITYMKERLVRE